MFSDPSPFAPIEGTQQAPRGLFVKRWGTLLVEPENGFPTEPDELEFVEGAIDCLYRAGRAGWNVYLVGNEEPVWKGDVDKAIWDRLQERIHAKLEAAGVPLVRDYACIDHPEGIPGRTNDSVYLLPNTGAFYQAAHFDGIDLQNSWLVGDETVELVAAWRAGVRTAGVRSGKGLGDGTFAVDPEIEGATLTEVVSTLLRLAAEMS